MRWITTLSLCTLALAGCVTYQRDFQPAERVRGVTVEGYREALYPLEGPGGRFGEAKIWSRGAVLFAQDGVDRTALHVALEVLNRGKLPIELRAEELRLEALHTDDGVLTELAPYRAHGVSVAPGTIGEAHFHFLLPEGLTPGDVEAFLLRWVVHAGDQVYVQRTPFTRERRYYDHVDVVYYHSLGYYPYPVYYERHYHCFPSCGPRGRGNVTRVRAR